MSIARCDAGSPARDRRTARLSRSARGCRAVPRRSSQAVSRRHAARAAAGLDRAGRGDHAAVQRSAASASCRSAATPATAAAPRPSADGSQIVLSLARMRRIRSLDPRELHDDRRSRLRARRGPGGSGLGRSAVSDEPRLGRLVPARRQSLDERGRHGGPALRHDARPRARPRSRAARWPRARWSQAAAQGQHRLRPARSVHRRGRHARRHHRSGVQAVLSPGVDRHRIRRRRPIRRRRSRCCRACARFTSDAVTTFELIPRIALDLVLQHIRHRPAIRSIGRIDWYVLLEIGMGRARRRPCAKRIEAELAAAMEAGEISRCGDRGERSAARDVLAAARNRFPKRSAAKARASSTTFP